MSVTLKSDPKNGEGSLSLPLTTSIPFLTEIYTDLHVRADSHPIVRSKRFVDMKIMWRHEVHTMNLAFLNTYIY